MAEPLTKSQQQLRGMQVRDMSIEELKDWIVACDRMEVWVKPNKVRRLWKDAREEAEAELFRRLGG